jgi:6-phosphofructo-2-kinase / fructose-2,6-biphosphatase 4
MACNATDIPKLEFPRDEIIEVWMCFGLGDHLLTLLKIIPSSYSNVAKRIQIPGLPKGPGPRNPMDVSVTPITFTVTVNEELVENNVGESDANKPPPQPLPMTHSAINPNA